jgi:hypothetical protein
MKIGKMRRIMTMTKWEKALELARQGKSIKEIREAGIGKTYARRAYKQAEKEHEAPSEQPEIETVKPEVEVTPEPVEPKIPKTLREKLDEKEQAKEEKPTEAPTEELPESKAFELNSEYITRVTWETVNGFLPEKRRKDKVHIDSLVEVWTPVVDKYLDKLIEQFGIEVFAIWITILVFAPELKDYVAPQVVNAVKSIGGRLRSGKGSA